MAYTDNAEFARIYGDQGTGVWITKTGKVLEAGLPTALKTDPGVAFAAAGWLGEDGIGLNIDKDIKEFNALQGGKLIKKKTLKVTQTVTFVMLEETALTLGLVYAEAGITVTGAGTLLDPKVARQNISDNQTKTIERSLVIDNVDGDTWDRYCIEAADLTFKGEIVLSKNDDIRAFKIEATILDGAAYHLTNSAGVTAGYPVATGATAGVPGSFTPTGAALPASLAALQAGSVVASPLTLWTVGQYVLLGDGTHAHWDSNSWEVGDAPA